MMRRPSQKSNKEEKNNVEKITNLYFPRGVPEIIQRYGYDDESSCDNPSITRSVSLFGNKNDPNDELVSLSALSFFSAGNKNYLAKKAAEYVLWAQPEKCKAIIRQHPDILLLSVENANGPCGEMKDVTPYQALLWANDNYIKDKEGKTFLEMARSYLSPEQVKEQEEKWFENWDEKAHVKELKVKFDKVAMIFDDYIILDTFDKYGTIVDWDYPRKLSEAMIKRDLGHDTTLISLHQAIKCFKDYLKNVVLHAKRNCIPQLWSHAYRFYTSNKYNNYGEQVKGVLDTIVVNSQAWMMQLRHGVILNVGEDDQVVRDDISSYYRVTSDDRTRSVDRFILALLSECPNNHLETIISQASKSEAHVKENSEGQTKPIHQSSLFMPKSRHPVQRFSSKTPLSREERNKLGNDYMRTAFKVR